MVMRKRAVFAASVAIISLTAVFSCSRRDKTTEVQAPPPLVEVMTVERRDIPLDRSYIGVTEGSEAVEIRSQVSGILKSRDYEEGAYVKRGQVLFRIEPDTYRAALDQALSNLAQTRAQLTQAEESFNRVATLFQKNAVSRQDYDNAKGTYDAARASSSAAAAAAEDARIRLGYTTIVSPVDGYAGKASMSVGNLVSASSADGNLLTVVNRVNPIYVNFSVPEPELAVTRELSALGILRSGEPYAEITYAGNVKFPYKGEINFIDKTINLSTGNINARAVFRNDNLTLMPGQFVTVYVRGSYLKDAIVIPQEALMQIMGRSMAVTVDADNNAHYKPLELGPSMGGYYLVLGGLSEGERVITQGTNKARQNAPVRIQPTGTGSADTK